MILMRRQVTSHFIQRVVTTMNRVMVETSVPGSNVVPRRGQTLHLIVVSRVASGIIQMVSSLVVTNVQEPSVDVSEIVGDTKTLNYQIFEFCDFIIL